MLIVVLWLVLAIIIGVAAGRRGRSGFGWFALAVVISPLIAGLILAVLPDLETRALLEEIRYGTGTSARAIQRNVARPRPPRSKLNIVAQIVAAACCAAVVAWVVAVAVGGR